MPQPETLIRFVYTSTIDLRGVENGKQNVRAMAVINRQQAQMMIGILKQPKDRRRALGLQLAHYLDDMRRQGKLDGQHGIPFYLMENGIVTSVTVPLYWRAANVLMHFLAEDTQHVVDVAVTQLEAYVAGRPIDAINPYASIAFQKSIEAKTVTK